jgi:hypothetical protein
MTAWWPRSLTSQVETRTDRDQIEAGIRHLSQPCDHAWLMARVLALITPYFTANVPEGVRRIEAEDWLSSLERFPSWAIEKACRWWKSDENHDHRRKPLEGDIVDRVKFEMGILSFAAMKVREYDEGFRKRTSEPERVAPTPEQMEQRRAFAKTVLRNNGFAKCIDRPKGPVRETVTDDDKAEIAAMLASRFGAGA